MFLWSDSEVADHKTSPTQHDVIVKKEKANVTPPSSTEVSRRRGGVAKQRRSSGVGKEEE